MNSFTRDQLNAVLRADFLSFLQKSASTLNPNSEFQLNWHHAAIAYQLDRIRRGEITRLIINLPPRSLKSIMVSVAFPAFWLGHDPGKKIFGISYSGDLASKHASDFRSITSSAWYRQAFPSMKIARSADSDHFTTRHGFRRATSIGATLTGLGGDCFIVDDPLKPIDAQSDTLRRTVNEWFSHTLISRLDDKRTGAIIVVMQRVHVDDLTGHILEASDGWEVLSLPAVAERDERIAIGPDRYHLWRAGEALHPEREPLAVLNGLRRELGSDLFSAQYQQAPVPPGGAMIKRHWLSYYDRLPERTYRTRVIQSWDTAAKDGAQNDWSVCTTWLVDGDRYYLLDVTRGRYEYPRLRDVALKLADRFKPRIILIEDASTGIALAQELKKYGRYNVKAVPVERDKISRLYIQQAQFEAGQVLFPKQAPWLAELEAELLAFPNGKTDDQVDSISQALANRNHGYDSTLSWV